MHKKILSKFNKLEKNYGEEFTISKNELHSIILNKKIKIKKLTFVGIITNLTLIFLSIVTIFLCKFKNIKIANYFIVHRKSYGDYDNRSKYILNNFNFKKSLNIVRCQTFIDSLITFFSFPNVIFYNPFDYFNSPFFLKKNSIKNNYIIIHQKERKNFIIIKFIFKFLKIKKFISIDDQRVIQIFLRACKNLNIKTYGYMHYKFSKYVIGIKYLCFDYFFVWSNYFKKKLIEVNKEYKNKKIYISGYPLKKTSISNMKKISILYIIDLNLNFNKVKILLKKLNNNNKIKLFLKLKPQNNTDDKWIKFCKNENIDYFENENLDLINKKINIDYFVATISTALLEATLYKALPVKLQTSNDFADDLISDNVVIKASNLNNILNTIKKKPSKKTLSKIFQKVWGKKKYNSTYIKKIISEKIY